MVSHVTPGKAAGLRSSSIRKRTCLPEDRSVRFELRHGGCGNGSKVLRLCRKRDWWAKRHAKRRQPAASQCNWNPRQTRREAGEVGAVGAVVEVGEVGEVGEVVEVVEVAAWRRPTFSRRQLEATRLAEKVHRQIQRLARMQTAESVRRGRVESKAARAAAWFRKVVESR
ncbi:hypothetical protein K490DRAFT_57765 [Saccharata proteae CBS 121410]|uniref:Uncharacterized protein n=1 Tax=Saccharata proteae CBS 121410 TaxID=1314787 RepID=A0A9P4HR83_9PEZI|nr:hypothetical protein K490DRAFT_57765 [Saccharata proteae CBS 121410]